MKEKNEIVASLTKAYNMELESLMNYLANSVMLDGVRAEEIKKALEADIPTELGHAQKLAERISILGGHVPGSLALTWDQKGVQPPADTTDVVSVIEGVIEAEAGAVEQYKLIIKLSEEVDPVTQDLAVTILADEEKHHHEFSGFLKEYRK